MDKPDWPHWVFTVLRQSGKILFCSLITYLSWRIARRIDPRASGIAFVWVAPLWMGIFARDLLGLIPFIKFSAEHALTKEWQGRYYSFNGRHLRFHLVDHVIWLPEADLRGWLIPELSERELRLLGADYGRITGLGEFGVSETGLLKLLNSRTEHRRADYQMIKFKRWLENETLPNIKRHPTSAQHPQ